MAYIHNVKLPIQKLSYSKKNKKWRKDNVDYADRFSYYYSEEVRQNLENKLTNLNLYNGIVDVRDINKAINPQGIDAEFIPDNIPHHPIMVPKIDLLVGEETKRRFDWKVITTNPNAISKKEEDKKKVLTESIVSFLNNNYEGEELDKKIQELDKYLKYEWQDFREKMANQILRHYWHEQEFELKFNKCFKDALIMGEEIIQVDIVQNEPVLIKLNPLKVRSLRSGNSDRIEDSSLIIIEDHWPPSKIVDFFHDQLKPADISTIVDDGSSNNKGSYSDDQNNHTLLRDSIDSSINDFITLAQINGHTFRANFEDENGNIRVIRIYWKSLKKIKKIKFYDEQGDIQEKIVSEEYIIDKNKGEEETIMWVNEIWEGTKIRDNIYIQMRPKKVQFNKLNNPSTCHAGIIGQVFNTNQGRAVSLVDRLKNYQYLYDAIWDRTYKAIATNHGKILELDLAKIPNNWDIEKWLYFATVNKLAVVDSFKEGNQGAATGKLAGGFNTQGGRAIDLEMGNYIQQHISMLEYIKLEMGEISGVSRQREGQVQNRETKGGIERSVTQSSHITEYWFMLHEKFKIRVLSAFLEVAKIALKGRNKKVQYILDDQTINTLNIDGDQFAEEDYGILVSSSNKTKELEETLKSYAQAFLQNGGSFSTIMDIFLSPSLSDMRRKLENAEEKMDESRNRAAQEQNKLEKERMIQEQELEKAKLELENIKNIRDNETKLAISQNSNKESEEDINEREKFEHTKNKEKEELILQMQKIKNDMEKHKDNIKIKEKQIKNKSK